jgi:hypothetical protein
MIFREHLVDVPYKWLWSSFENSTSQLVELITVNGHPQQELEDISWLRLAPLKSLVLQSWSVLLKTITWIRRSTHHPGLQNLSRITFLDCRRSIARTKPMSYGTIQICSVRKENVTIDIPLEATYQQLLSQLKDLEVIMYASTESEAEYCDDEYDIAD